MAIPNFLDSSPALHRQTSAAWVVRRGQLGTTLVWFNIPSRSCSEYHPVLLRCHSMLRHFEWKWIWGKTCQHCVFTLNISQHGLQTSRKCPFLIHSRYVDSGALSWTTSHLWWRAGRLKVTSTFTRLAGCEPWLTLFGKVFVPHRDQTVNDGSWGSHEDDEEE